MSVKNAVSYISYCFSKFISNLGLMGIFFPLLPVLFEGNKIYGDFEMLSRQPAILTFVLPILLVLTLVFFAALRISTRKIKNVNQSTKYVVGFFCVFYIFSVGLGEQPVIWLVAPIILLLCHSVLINVFGMMPVPWNNIIIAALLSSFVGVIAAFLSLKIAVTVLSTVLTYRILVNFRA